MKKRSRMSFFTKNLLLSSVNIFLIGMLLIVSSYFIQKSILITQLQNQIKTVTEAWAKQIDTGQIQKAIAEKSYKGPVQTELRTLMDSVSKYNPSIAQAYVFGTELQDGNKTSLIAVPTHLVEPLEQAKLNIGDMYEQPKVVVNTVQKMLDTNAPALSDYYTDDLGIWTTITYPIKDASGKTFAYFAVDTDARAIPDGLHKLLINGISILLGFLVIILLIQYFIVRKTLSPIKALIHGIEEVSSGNLDVQIAVGKDDLGIINEKFNTMVRTINHMMVKVQEMSVQVATSAKGLYTSSEENTEHVDKINTNMKKIANSITYQEKSSSEGSRAISEMATVIQTIAFSSSTLSDEANHVENKSAEGDLMVKKMADQMQLITDFVKETSDTVTLLDRRSQEIGNILDIITGIANQTNLLALNAAIEASRVGEHGRGFAVVAGEVRKLAEQSQQSANQISALITEIQGGIHQAAQSMSHGNLVVTEGMTIAKQTGHLFTEILHATKEVSGQIQGVSSAAQEMSAGTEEISASADELNQAVSQTAASANEITHSIEEQKHYMETIVNSSNQLSATADELKELMKQFRVKKI
ncbi:methyl-accepting chemotaxis protein [Paenibacillus sp. SYP-B3998]|uniref:Methyl-accepting chemotaxis protein n=1 Tax=Paenibacillus sp. SYP-B3998 TaxID=2678564 RepID=A0A6G3ZZX8_9BACL|nr:methyl-accepting chemotaxis protein [Paenibacillus sp. SYP-B3998]NEW07692.1 methyl-accepting chemotaxis protein [Paenibacillus sp. SYP-B3998]